MAAATGIAQKYVVKTETHHDRDEEDSLDM